MLSELVLNIDKTKLMRFNVEASTMQYRKKLGLSCAKLTISLR